jgi:protein TonB
MKTYLFPLALSLSAALHVVGAGWAQPAKDPSIEGGDVAGVVALGLGFQDLVKASAGTKAAPVEPTDSVRPDHTPKPVSEQTASTARPTSTSAPASTPSTNTAATPSSAPISSTEMLASVRTLTKTAEVVPQRTATSTTSQKITAVTSVSDKPSATPPTHRPTRAPKAVQQAAPKPPAARSQARAGNAPVNAQKGQASGLAQGKQAEASTKASTSTAKAVGNGATRSYQGAVMRKISRVPKRAAGARGTAIVRITIASSGSISKAALAKSSGHAGIDKIAVAQIKRAGPFSPTPTGKSMTLTVGFESKG